MLKFLGLVSLLTLFSFVIQVMLPKIPLAGNAQVLIVHAVFFSVAMSVSFPAMLGFAFVDGIVWDCLTMSAPSSSRIEAALADSALPPGVTEMGLDLPIGFTALLFALFGALVQGVRPLFGKGRWELPLLLTGVSVFFMQIVESLAYSLFRLRFDYTSDLWVKMISQAFFVMSISPLLIFLVHKFARWSQYSITPGAQIRLRYGR